MGYSLQATQDSIAGPLNLASIEKPFKSSKYKTPKKSKNLKQILAAEKTQDLDLNVPTCKVGHMDCVEYID